MRTDSTEDQSVDVDQATVREVLDAVRGDRGRVLSAPEAKRVCDAYGIAAPHEGLATSSQQAVELAQEIGFPVVLKIVSPQILYKTEAGGVLVGLTSAEQVARGYDTIIANARAYPAEVSVTGVDATFRLAPTTADEALKMISGIRAAEVLRGVRGAAPAIAVIGASEQEGKIGNSVMRNLIDGGFRGDIYPVNPKATEIMGRKVYADASELPHGIDVAVFAIPAKLVVETIAKIGDRGIPTAILSPSGFAETGEVEDADGSRPT